MTTVKFNDSTIYNTHCDKSFMGIWKPAHLRDAHHQSPEMAEWWLVQYLQPAIEIILHIQISNLSIS